MLNHLISLSFRYTDGGDRTVPAPNLHKRTVAVPGAEGYACGNGCDGKSAGAGLLLRALWAGIRAEAPGVRRLRGCADAAVVSTDEPADAVRGGSVQFGGGVAGAATARVCARAPRWSAFPGMALAR